MQGPTIFANIPGNRVDSRRSTISRLRTRLFLALLPIVTLALIATSIFWLHWASQRGIALGYPAPEVHITSSTPGTVLLNQSVQFSASGSGRDASFVWDFGDGSYSYGQDVSHSYQRLAGSQNNYMYTVTVTIRDAIGQVSYYSTSLRVMPPPPTASFTYTPGYYYVSFDASASSADPSTSIVSYHWDFGDGYSDTPSYPQYSRYYTSAGTYTVTLTVTDATGQTSQPASVPIVLQ